MFLEIQDGNVINSESIVAVLKLNDNAVAEAAKKGLFIGYAIFLVNGTNVNITTEQWKNLMIKLKPEKI